jgi:hypothetical protein
MFALWELIFAGLVAVVIVFRFRDAFMSRGMYPSPEEHKPVSRRQRESE